MKSKLAVLSALVIVGASLGILALVPTGAADPGPGQESQSQGPPQGVPANDRAKGRVYDGLAPGQDGTLCAGIFEIRDDHAGSNGDRMSCTHGPDDAPAEADVAAAVAPMSSTAIAGAPRIACPSGDDGTSGFRVQAIYAYEQGKTNRYSTFAASFPAYAGNVESSHAASAAQTGGVRHVRWVTDTQCRLDVRVTALPAGSLASIGTMRDALRAQGFDSTARKYLVWADSAVYCGIGYIYQDDSPQGDGTTNANDGKYSMFARVDNGCWGLANSVEAHELMHNLGGVQNTAPHGTTGSHCVDDSDRMCYNDGKLKAGQTMLSLCGAAQERLFDCGHDDYYGTSPASGSYLGTHWNAASSRFLFQTAAMTTTTATSSSSSATPTATSTPTSTPTTTTSPSPLTATFTPKSVGNDWWVETAVSASKPIAKVEAKVGSGAWVVLPKTDWGTYAKSLNAPNGSLVTFRATDTTGGVATSKAYTWP
ncbi:MAG TPA: hypothetical protein VM327_01890 [Candidatus Thermoplasmatota archaeon]|nr:hypothetical protein [Candidatus Thermoplasmatota archaeon]